MPPKFNIKPTTYTVESEAGTVLVQDVIVGDLIRAEKSGSIEELIRDRMVVSITKSPESEPVRTADMSPEDMDVAAAAVKNDIDRPALDLKNALSARTSGLAELGRHIAWHPTPPVQSMRRDVLSPLMPVMTTAASRDNNSDAGGDTGSWWGTNWRWVVSTIIATSGVGIAAIALLLGVLT